MLYFIAAIYGLIIGNYLTSAYFRIPRNIPLNGINRKIGKKPHCSICEHDLKFYEYFPPLNWVTTWFKCNYCKTPIDPTYMILEVSITIISIIIFRITQMTPIFPIAVLLAASIVLNIVLLFKYKKFYLKSTIAMLVLGIIFFCDIIKFF